MQQTEKYQFNLIEGSDSFLPGPLNDNARKMEAALAGWSTISPVLTEKTLNQEASEFTVSVEGLELHRFHYVLVDVLPPEGFSGWSYFLLQLNNSKKYVMLNGVYETNVEYLTSGKLITMRDPRPRARMVLGTYQDPDALVDAVLLNMGRICGSSVKVSELKSLRLYCTSDYKLPAGMRVQVRGVW